MSTSRAVRLGTEKARVLVIGADRQEQRFLGSLLNAAGYRPQFSNEGVTVVALSPDLVLLELGLADARGHDAILEIRRHSDVPMITLCAGARESDLVAALDLGADDVVERPFRPGELLARIRAVLRRGLKSKGEEAVYVAGNLFVDVLDHSVKRAGVPIKLTPMEFQILALLARNSGRVVPYERLLEELSKGSYRRSRRALRTSIWALRHKIEESPSDPQILQTEGRIGYRLSVASIKAI